MAVNYVTSRALVAKNGARVDLLVSLFDECKLQWVFRRSPPNVG
jgi:hypothetical protein